MSKRLGLHIGGRRFDVDVAEDFAPYLENEMKKDFNVGGNNDLKLILQSYVRKTHEIYAMEQEMQELLKKLNKTSIN